MVTVKKNSHSRSSGIVSAGIQPRCHVPAGNENKTVKSGARGPERSCAFFKIDILNDTDSGPEVIKLFSRSTQLSTQFILLINVKMPTIVTIVGILTFNGMINTTSERLKPRNFLICRRFSFYEQLKVRAQLS